MVAARDMSIKSVKTRLRSYMLHASQMLKDLPDIYKPGASRDEDNSDSEEEGGESKKRKVAFEKRRQTLVKRGLAGNASRAQSRQELEERLKVKLASFNPERRGKSEKKQQKLAKKAIVLEKKREKMKEKKKRERQRNKMRKKGAAAQDGESANGGDRSVKESGESNGIAPGPVKAVEKPKIKKVEVKVRQEDEQIAFSKFDFAGAGQDETAKKANKSLKKVLSSLQKNKEKQDKLKEKGDVEGLKILKEKTSWDNALSKAEGKKVKTDISLVKKTLKRKEAKKKSSGKQWKSRLAKQDDQQKQRQEKRSTNLQSRRDAKVKKKVKRSINKGRVVF